ncbi:MAG: hydroxysqualene dehydroxylase HpnE [Burkholderiaceae bacterium]|nr:hydroxysqualene dehydroxylase HpnE [Burkholderiaceae bacterium]
MRIAVVGGGWAGLAAAVDATDHGHAVNLFEMAAQLGGRARRVNSDGLALDNGQHILIGAYTQTLRLMRIVGLEPEHLLLRTPLRIAYPDGQGLTLPAGPAMLAFTRGVMAHKAWSWREKLSLLATATRWARTSFRCDPSLSVSQLCATLPSAVRAELIDPLCVAALNTPVDNASASVFLSVLHDALFTGAGSADLLLPKTDLSALWPDSAARWLAQSGARCHLSQRVGLLERDGGAWRVDEEPFDAVVLAASAVEAARLARPIAPAWSASAEALRYEPIVTVTLRSNGTQLAHPMLALRYSDTAPAQFVFDQGQLRGMAGLLTFVISGARAWVDRGLDATVEATLAQAQQALVAQLRGPLQRVYALVEKRATFLCTPGLIRPPSQIAAGLFAAGDYVAGPYPATLEGAVRSGAYAAEVSGAQTAPPAARR